MIGNVILENMVRKTYYPKTDEIQRDWYLADAEGQNLGRFASEIAKKLIGKHKPSFTPGVDTGDFVVVVNCEQIAVTGNKLDDKMYYRHSQYPGGLKEKTLRQMLATRPERVMRQAVWGMLPHNKLGRKMLKRLKAYTGTEHPHVAHQLKPLLAADKE
jgi:large subunit ribosomal protein L13